MAGIDRKLPIGIQGFAGLRMDQYVYVDKTKHIYNLVHGGKEYFLSRPRRFGKSLFLSTLRAYWEGRRDLFRGLDIERLETSNPDAWTPHPTFFFDFTGENYQKEAALEEIIDEHLRHWEAGYGIDSAEGSLGKRFRQLIMTANRKTSLRCVVLVDEYDKPLLESMQDADLEAHNQAVFKGFFSSLKGMDEYVRFVFITGVTKFEKVSIFSDLNQLEDISLDEDYADICGITEKELDRDFQPEIVRMSDERGITEDACRGHLKRAYNGYHFSSNPNKGVYNPYDLLTALKKRKFGSYWFETGTPTFLVRMLRNNCFDVRRLTDGSIYTTDSRTRMLADWKVQE